MTGRKRLIVFGADGQVGWELQRSLSALGEVVPFTERDLDFRDVAGLRDAIRVHQPAFIVNAAAYTAVDKAESQVDLARAVNATAPSVMAEEAQKLGAWLLHYSTDYVYDGTKPSPYVEGDPTNPLSVYGRTKLEGDEAIARSGARHLVLRTSWVYAAHGANFVKTILRLARERDELSVVSDQHGAPTSAELLADVTAHAVRSAIADRLEPGTFHATAAGSTSWHGFASYIVQEARAAGVTLRLAPERIKPIPTEAYPVAATRPKNSRLDCGRLERVLGLALPEWQWHAARAIKELVAP